MATSYRTILIHPGARSFTSAGLIARFPMSMVGISTILAVEELYGSYTAAGLVSAASFVAMAVAVHRGNLFRTLISGVIIMSITLWIATQTIGLHTQLAANAGALKAGGMVASMDQGGSPITWLLIQVFSPQNIPGFIIIGAIYLTGIFMTWRRARGFIKQEKVVLAE